MSNSVDQQSPCPVVFVSSAFNEEANLRELYHRCLKAFDVLCSNLEGRRLEFSLLLIDNASTDQTPEIVKHLVREDPRVQGIRNLRNYGAEPSFALGLSLAKADLFVLLCADLQDPPELAGQMLVTILTEPHDYDAVIARKCRSSGSPIVRMFRKIYYRLLGFSDRDTNVYPGFHGFGCYQSSVIEQALQLWNHTPLNLRQCLSSASLHPSVLTYEQSDRIAGSSKYRFMSYLRLVTNDIFSGKSLASRLSIRSGFLIFLLSVFLGLFVVINFVTGHSGYARGVPTLAVLILLSSSFQVIILSLISRQIEQGLYRSARPKIPFRGL